MQGLPKETATATGPGEPLNANDILCAEFAYISQTAFQANEDRARVTNFYLVTLGGLIAGLFGSQIQSLRAPEIYWAFAALFSVLFLTSILTLLQLIRLREAWFESARAMNQIKAYYQAALPGLDLPRAFRWQVTSLPARHKPWSVGYLLALQVAVLGGTSAGAAVIFAGLAGGLWLWGAAVAVALAGAAAQMALYWAILREQSWAAAAPANLAAEAK